MDCLRRSGAASPSDNMEVAKLETPDFWNTIVIIVEPLVTFLVSVECDNALHLLDLHHRQVRRSQEFQFSVCQDSSCRRANACGWHLADTMSKENCSEANAPPPVVSSMVVYSVYGISEPDEHPWMLPEVDATSSSPGWVSMVSVSGSWAPICESDCPMWDRACPPCSVKIPACTMLFHAALPFS